MQHKIRQERDLGQEVFTSLMRGKATELGARPQGEPLHVGRLRIETLTYRVGDKNMDWVVASSRSGSTESTTVIPVLEHEGSEFLVMLWKPYPALNRFIPGFPGGGVKYLEPILAAAGRELQEETGYTAQTFESMGKLSDSAEHSSTVDYLLIARGLTSGEPDREYQETHFKNMLLTVSEVAQLVDRSAILPSITVAAFHRYLIATDPAIKAAYDAIMQ